MTTTPTINMRGASSVVVSSLVAAVSGYLILLLVAHRLTPAENANFLVFWASLFAVIGVLGGVQSETTRGVGMAEFEVEKAGALSRASVLRNGLLVGLALAMTIAMSSKVWAASMFPHDTAVLVLLLVVAALVYAGHAAAAGASAGRRDWTTYSRLMAVESSWRLAAVAAVSLIGGDTVLLPAACISSAVVWLLLTLVSGRTRRAVRARADVNAPVLLRQTGHSLLSAASTSTLIVGFPILLRLTSAPAEYAVSAPLILAISITRAPIMMPLQAFQGVFISAFLRHRNKGVRAVLAPALTMCFVGVVAAAGAFWAGRFVMALFGSAYHVARVTLAVLTLDAALLAVLTLSGTAVLASGRHRWYSAGWMTASCVSVGLLLLPLPIGDRAMISLAVGPICGVAVHWLAIALSGDNPRQTGRSDVTIG